MTNTVTQSTYVVCTTQIRAECAMILAALLTRSGAGPLGPMWGSITQSLMVGTIVTSQITFCICSLLLSCLALTYVLTRAKPVYLLDFALYQPPAECAAAATTPPHAERLKEEELWYQRAPL